MFNTIQKLGYVGLFIGSLVEGESVVLSISSMAYFGKFYLPKVMLIAFLGTLIADQLSFYLGKIAGRKVLRKFPVLKTKAARVLNLLEKYDVPFILGFRFIYGIRIISPFFIGMSSIPVWKFSVLNLVAAVIWSVLSCSLGYCIGAFSNVIGHNHASVALVFNLLVTLTIVIIFHVVSRRLIKNK